MQKSYIPHSKEGCRILMNALRAVNVEQAREEMHQAKRVAAWTSAISLLFLVLWILLMVVRVNGMKRVRWRILIDILCVSLSSAAMVVASLGAIQTSSTRLLPFTQPVIEKLPGDWKAYYDTLQTLGDETDPCRNQFSVDSGIFIEEDLVFILVRIKILQQAHTSSALYWFTITMCCIAVLLFITSIVALFLSMFYRPPASEENRFWSAGNTNSRTFHGVFQPSEAVEFFMRFIESIPSPTEGVQLPTQRTVLPTQNTVIAGWGEENDCQICLEVMLEDIARLYGCRHTFHQRCILKWLLFSDKPNCPLCTEPLRLCDKSTKNNDEENQVQDSNKASDA